MIYWGIYGWLEAGLRWKDVWVNPDGWLQFISSTSSLWMKLESVLIIQASVSLWVHGALTYLLKFWELMVMCWKALCTLFDNYFLNLILLYCVTGAVDADMTKHVYYPQRCHRLVGKNTHTWKQNSTQKWQRYDLKNRELWKHRMPIQSGERSG